MLVDVLPRARACIHQNDENPSHSPQNALKTEASERMVDAVAATRISGDMQRGRVARRRIVIRLPERASRHGCVARSFRRSRVQPMLVTANMARRP